MSILVGRKYRGVHNTSMIVKVIALGKKRVLVESVEGISTHVVGDEFVTAGTLEDFSLNWRLMPEERTINLRVWPDGLISGAGRDNNLRLTLADGELVNAEVIKCS